MRERAYVSSIRKYNFRRSSLQFCRRVRETSLSRGRVKFPRRLFSIIRSLLYALASVFARGTDATNRLIYGFSDARHVCFEFQSLVYPRTLLAVSLDDKVSRSVTRDLTGILIRVPNRNWTRRLTDIDSVARASQFRQVELTGKGHRLRGPRRAAPRTPPFRSSTGYAWRTRSRDLLV